MKPRALASAAGIAILLAAACGGAYSPPNDTATQSSSPSQAAGSITEKPFAPGGKIDMQLAAGGYVVRAARDNTIRVTLGSGSTATVDVSTQDVDEAVARIGDLLREAPALRPAT